MNDYLTKLYTEDKKLLKEMICKVITNACNDDIISICFVKQFESIFQIDYEITADAEFRTQNDYHLDNAIFESIDEYIECKSNAPYVRFAGEISDYAYFFGELQAKTEGKFILGNLQEITIYDIYLKTEPTRKTCEELLALHK